MDRTPLGSESRWERYAGSGGILFGIVLLLLFSIDSSPADGATAEEWLAYLAESPGTKVFYVLLGGVALLALLWCLGSVRSILARAEAGEQRVTTFMFTAGALALLLVGISLASAWGTAISSEFFTAFEADAQIGLALLGFGGVVFAYAAMAAGVAVGAAAIVMLRTATFPKWFAWASLIAGIAIFAGALLDITFLLFPVWAIVIGALVMAGVETGTMEQEEVKRPASTERKVPTA